MYAHEYVENDVLNLDGLELVCLLYSKAIERLNQARTVGDAARVPERTELIGRAMEIVAQLQATLDPEKGAEIAANLADLYSYIQERLAEAIASREQAPLDEAVVLLSILYQGWNECRAVQQAAPEDPSRVQSEPAEVEASRSWTL